MRRTLLAATFAAPLSILLLAPSAGATVNHGDFVGTHVDFLDVSETTLSAGDAEPLWSAPSLAGSGDQLIFFPPNFSSSCSGGGSDVTSSMLTMTIEAKSGAHIEDISFVEHGDATLIAFPPPGNPLTNATAAFAGTVTVTDTASGPIAPVVIPFAGTIVPSPIFALPDDFGGNTWATGTVSVDVAAVVAEATRVELSLDNTLETACGAGATSAKIQKKVVSGPSVTVGLGGD